MKPIVDQNKCIGCGNCEFTCPKVFQIKDGKAHVKKNIKYEDYKECIHSTVNDCPVQAIKLED